MSPPIDLSLCKKVSPKIMRHEDKHFCVAFTHDYGEVITGLVVPKDQDGNKSFSLPYLNIKLKDLEKVNGEGYELKVGGKTMVIPSKSILRFVAEVKKDIARHRQDSRQKRRR